MKKFSVVLLILSVSLLSGGCLGKLAVQSLNNKARQYMNEGKTEEAISRLEASIDLDDTIYETYYNLAIAYMDIDKTDKAQEALNRVIELNPDFPEAYYVMAVIYEDNAYSIINGNNANKTEIVSDEGGNVQMKKELSEEEKSKIASDIKSAVNYYNKYLSKQQNSSDKAKVTAKISTLKSELVKYDTPDNEEKSN